MLCGEQLGALVLQPNKVAKLNNYCNLLSSLLQGKGGVPVIVVGRREWQEGRAGEQEMGSKQEG